MADTGTEVDWNAVNEYILQTRAGHARAKNPAKKVAVKVAEMTGLPYDLALQYVKLTRDSPSVEIRGYHKRKPWQQKRKRAATAAPPVQDPQ